MAHIKIKGIWYLEEDLTDVDKIRLGVKKKDDFNEEEILKELKETPASVKKNHAKKRKKGNNISAKNIEISSPSLKENEQKGGK